jgi:hypothetical protein
MKRENLIEKLTAFPEGIDVMILDGFNAQGEPREINFTSTRVITQRNANEGADCEGRVGEEVAVLCFGYY